MRNNIINSSHALLTSVPKLGLSHECRSCPTFLLKALLSVANVSQGSLGRSFHDWSLSDSKLQKVSVKPILQFQKKKTNLCGRKVTIHMQCYRKFWKLLLEKLTPALWIKTSQHQIHAFHCTYENLFKPGHVFKSEKKNLGLHVPKGFQIPEDSLNMHSLSQFIVMTNLCICHSQRRMKLVQRFTVSLPHSISQMLCARH